MKGSRAAWLGLALAAVVIVGAGITALAVLPKRSTAPAALLQRTKVWDYQLQKANLDRFAASAADLVVMDYSRDGSGSGAYARGDIDRVRQRPDGGRRLVIAYLSIGEAEEYRYYWRPEWKTSPPGWLFGENCRWPGNHLVRFWNDEWKNIVFRGADSYLGRIAAAGFDGIYVDRIDAYWDLRETYPNGRAEMLAFMKQLSAAARAMKPPLLVIAQNAEDLLSDPAYRAGIDAIAKEDLLFGINGSGVRNDEKLLSWSLGQLALLKQDRKPVFAVEYLADPRQVRDARREFIAKGMRPTFPPRSLDGSDPLIPPPPAPVGQVTTSVVGTPEFGQKHCK